MTYDYYDYDYVPKRTTIRTEGGLDLALDLALDLILSY